MLDDARKRHADAFDAIERQPGVGDAAAHAVLHEIGDDGGGLAVDAHRLGQLGKHVALEIGDDVDDAVGRDLYADDAGGIGIELKQHARAAARWRRGRRPSDAARRARPPAAPR